MSNFMSQELDERMQQAVARAPAFALSQPPSTLSQPLPASRQEANDLNPSQSQLSQLQIEIHDRIDAIRQEVKGLSVPVNSLDSKIAENR